MSYRRRHESPGLEVEGSTAGATADVDLDAIDDCRRLSFMKAQLDIATQLSEMALEIIKGIQERIEDLESKRFHKAYDKVVNRDGIKSAH